MKNKIILFVITFILHFSILVNAQENFSSQARHAMHHLQKYNKSKQQKNVRINTGISDKVKTELGIYTKNGIYFLRSLIMVDKSINEKALTDIGIVINTKADNIWSVEIPIEALEVISLMKGIVSLDSGGDMKLLLDKVRAETKAIKVHAGKGLPASYLGDSVVVGIIDMGFDYTHPMFYDKDTKRSRISRVWNQVYHSDEGGLNASSPAGYGYGVELTNLQEIINSIDTSNYQDETNLFYVSDGSGESHGTFVTGIAAGSGLGTNGVYDGMAPKAEIVLVAIDESWTSSQVVDGIQYIFDYAASVNKPAVINLSFGTQLGPHDGTSLLSQAFNNLSGPGKILVGAAGNDGEGNVHLAHTFKRKETVVTTLGVPSYRTLTSEVVDCWGSVGTLFSVKVMVNKNEVFIGETKMISSSLNAITLDTIYSNADTVFIEIISQKINPLNRRPTIQVHINTNRANIDLSFDLAVTATHGTVHAWCLQTGFLSGETTGHIGGNSANSIVDGQTAQNIITVGAYVTRNSYTNLYGYEQSFEDEVPVGALAPFSSIGPTLDNRTKPDITAPGAAIISSISSFDIYYAFYDEQDNTVTDAITSPINGRTYRFSAESGTSFSSPVVAGAVALMLEANPNLTPYQTINILRNTAREDKFTGNIPRNGNNRWGWGKIDSYAAVKEALQVRECTSEIIIKKQLLSVYPNPSNTEFTIDLKNLLNKQIALRLTDRWGETHIQKSMFVYPTLQQLSVDSQRLKEGIYVLQVFDGKEHHQTKVVIKR